MPVVWGEKDLEMMLAYILYERNKGEGLRPEDRTETVCLVKNQNPRYEPNQNYPAYLWVTRGDVLGVSVRGRVGEGDWSEVNKKFNNSDRTWGGEASLLIWYYDFMDEARSLSFAYSTATAGECLLQRFGYPHPYDKKRYISIEGSVNQFNGNLEHGLLNSDERAITPIMIARWIWETYAKHVAQHMTEHGIEEESYPNSSPGWGEVLLGKD